MLNIIYRQVGVVLYEQMFEKGTDSQAFEAIVDDEPKFSVASLTSDVLNFKVDKAPRKVISLSHEEILNK